ncbi:MAG: hypothetical protein ACE5K3_00945 [bacterium]
MNSEDMRDVVNRAVLKMFGKRQEDVDIRYGRYLAWKIREEKDATIQSHKPSN